MSSSDGPVPVPVRDESVGPKRAALLSLRPAGIFALSRVGIFLIISAMALSAHQSIMSKLINWDAKWYLLIAEKGYVHSVPLGHGNPAQCDLGFFPLLPLLVRWVHFVTGFGFNVAGILTTTLLGLFASVAVWWLLREFFGRVGADRGTALIFLSPGAFVLSMVYTEGAIILFVACSMLALQRRRWLLAGLCAAAATAADPVGTAAIVPCVVACVVAIRTRGEWRSILAPLTAPLGVGLFFLYLWFHTGSPFSWLHAQRVGWQSGYLGTGIPEAMWHFFDHGFVDPNYGVKAVSAFTVVGLLVLFFRAHPPAPWVGYVVTVLVFGALSPVIGVTPRLLLRDFPLLGVVGAKLPPVWFEVTLAFSVMLLAALTIAAGGWRWTP